jgi:dsRNA-specific ribonuclease
MKVEVGGRAVELRGHHPNPIRALSFSVHRSFSFLTRHDSGELDHNFSTTSQLATEGRLTNSSLELAVWIEPGGFPSQMKGLRLLRWSGTILSPRTKPTRLPIQQFYSVRRRQSSASPALQSDHDQEIEDDTETSLSSRLPDLVDLPSPPYSQALSSAKLSALHARLSLPKKVPIQTLARALVDSSADTTPQFNNQSFSLLGADLLSSYTSEYLICKYPRLPLSVLFAAMYAYIGPKTLESITREWGVQRAAEPGGEVDPGYLQFKPLPPDTALDDPNSGVGSGRARQELGYRRGLSSRTVYDDPFGDMRTDLGPARSTIDAESEKVLKGVTLEKASSTFVRAVVGALYLHAGRPAAKTFYKNHFLSRHVPMASLFDFQQPTRDLSRLCAREGFESPIARLLSETGRKSRSPVYVVGVYSGREKLGEGAGASLDEARTRAAVAALKGWYLYSPLEVRVPSETEDEVDGTRRPWEPVYVDTGEVVC